MWSTKAYRKKFFRQPKPQGDQNQELDGHLSGVRRLTQLLKNTDTFNK